LFGLVGLFCTGWCSNDFSFFFGGFSLDFFNGFSTALAGFGERLLGAAGLDFFFSNLYRFCGYDLFLYFSRYFCG
jgi:hypothetical protein